LIASKINAYDNLNQGLFSESLKSSGVNLTTTKDKYFINDKIEFMALSPNQEVQVFIENKPRKSKSVKDPSGDFYKTHRPSTFTFKGAFGIINIDGSNDERTFSISDIPLVVEAK
jgi:hypothetical protein